MIPHVGQNAGRGDVQEWRKVGAEVVPHAANPVQPLRRRSSQHDHIAPLHVRHRRMQRQQTLLKERVRPRKFTKRVEQLKGRVGRK